MRDKLIQSQSICLFHNDLSMNLDISTIYLGSNTNKFNYTMMTTTSIDQPMNIYFFHIIPHEYFAQIESSNFSKCHNSSII